MEIIQVDDVRRQIEQLKKYLRVVEAGDHSLLSDGTVREVDFRLSPDKKLVYPDRTVGLSFVRSMQKFKSLVKLKRKYVTQVDIYAIDALTVTIKGLEFIPDKPGHVSLVVTEQMKTSELIEKLELLAKKMEYIGRMWVSL